MKFVAALILAAFLTSSASAQVATGKPQPAIGTPLATRLVKIFSELESQLSVAASKGDSGALSRLLDASFETRTAATPGKPLPRAEWIASARNSDTNGRIEQMAVQDHETVAVVSFTLREKKSARFIVDVWAQHGGEWMLRTRYTSPGN
jgi:hypothetical protein